jgi:hypothetical protein
LGRPEDCHRSLNRSVYSLHNIVACYIFLGVWHLIGEYVLRGKLFGLR